MQHDRRNNAFPYTFLTEKTVGKSVLAWDVDKVVVVLSKTVLAHASSLRAHGNKKPSNLKAFAKNAWSPLNGVALRFFVRFFLRREKKLTENETVRDLWDELSLALLPHGALALIAACFDHVTFLVLASNAFDRITVLIDTMIVVHVVRGNGRALNKIRHETMVPWGHEFVRDGFVFTIEEVFLHNRLRNFFVELAAHHENLWVSFRVDFAFFCFARNLKPMVRA